MSIAKKGVTYNSERTKIEEHAEKPYGKTAINKVMTMLEMELRGGQCSLMGPDTHG